MNTNLIFLKLGGSLITDKNTPQHARLDVLNRLSSEIARFLSEQPTCQILLGHGSGSFGHIPAKRYNTRNGVQTEEQWRGFSEVWHAARALNTIVMQALHQQHIAAISFPPCAQVQTASHKIIRWDTMQIKAAIENRIVPVVYGDVVFDQEIGGTILSTEEQFEHLAAIFKPKSVLLAGIETGVWQEFPARKTYFPIITPQNIAEVSQALAASESPDVTGGMQSKVTSMMKMIQSAACEEIAIFSGNEAENLLLALRGDQIGSRIRL